MKTIDLVLIVVSIITLSYLFLKNKNVEFLEHIPSEKYEPEIQRNENFEPEIIDAEYELVNDSSFEENSFDYELI